MSEAKRPANAGEPLTRLLAVLAQSQSRRVVRHFVHSDDTTATLAEVATAVAEMDASADSEHTLITLHHATLPKLSAAGIVTYDPIERRVRYEGETFDDETRELLVEASTLA